MYLSHIVSSLVWFLQNFSCLLGGGYVGYYLKNDIIQILVDIASAS